MALHSFLLFSFFGRMLLQIIIERTCLYLQLLPNELYNSHIHILRGKVYAILVLPLLSYISRPRLVTSFSRVFSFAADTRQLFPPAQTRMGSLVQPHIF